MANNESTSGNTLTANDLQGIINDKSVKIHKIEEDIAKLKQAIQDIDRAKDYFRHSAEDIKTLQYEAEFIFKGRSADAFMDKLKNYRKFCKARVECLDILRNNYEKQIEDLNMQKVWAERISAFLKDQMERLRNIEVRGK